MKRNDPAPLVVVERCPNCGARLVLRRNRTTGNLFVDCAGWRRCTFVEEYDTRVEHPLGQLEELQDLAVEVNALLERLRPRRLAGRAA
jgi:ssDNA-binding Zn-finger/Zn-ribbon topoisomerase 1